MVGSHKFSRTVSIKWYFFFTKMSTIDAAIIKALVEHIGGNPDSIPDGTIGGGGGTSYTAGDGIKITDNTISVKCGSSDLIFMDGGALCTARKIPDTTGTRADVNITNTGSKLYLENSIYDVLPGSILYLEGKTYGTQRIVFIDDASTSSDIRAIAKDGTLIHFTKQSANLYSSDPIAVDCVPPAHEGYGLFRRREWDVEDTYSVFDMNSILKYIFSKIDTA